MSQVIRNFRDLQQFGIIFLTGESDGTGLGRGVCDFTEKGRRILARVFGVDDFKGNAPWNVSTNGELHVGSILLTRDMVSLIGTIGLLESGCKSVYQFYRHEEHKPSMIELDCAMGVDAGREEKEMANFLKFAEEDDIQWRTYSYRGTAGDRNEHLFSGRVS